MTMRANHDRAFSSFAPLPQKDVVLVPIVSMLVSYFREVFGAYPATVQISRRYHDVDSSGLRDAVSQMDHSSHPELQ